MRPVLMIHEVHQSMFDLPLSDYILTFDDGLYSQYYYWQQIKQLPTQKYFFISSNIYCRNSVQNTRFVDCITAHEKASTGNYEDYMTVEQIVELSRDPSVVIGGHGHVHHDLRKTSGLQNRINFMVEDTNLMIEWFKHQLNFMPDTFCFPYNNDVDALYTAVLKHAGFTRFFGRERIPIETLLQKEIPSVCL